MLDEGLETFLFFSGVGGKCNKPALQPVEPGQETFVC